MRKRHIGLLAAMPPLAGLVLLLVHTARVACVSIPIVDASVDAAEEPTFAIDREEELGEESGGRVGEDSLVAILLGGQGGHVLAGSFHVHTTASDGRGDLDDVSRAAARAGLDFLVLGDHNVDPPPAHYRDGVLIVPGVELSTSAGHLLAAGAERTAGWTLREEDPVGAARFAGGMAVLAHPVNRRLPWTGDWMSVDGMEVVSGDSLIREAMARPFVRLLPAVASLPASTTIGWLSIHHRPAEAFESWDAHPHLVGLCAHDAHGYEGYFGPFQAMQLRVRLSAPLPEDPKSAANKVVKALMEGRVWCTLGALADPAGFVLEKSFEPRSLTAALRYRDWPDSARPRVLLFRDGEKVSEGIFEASVSPASDGLYRAEVFLDLPWIWGRREFLWLFTSTIQIGGE